MMEHVVRRGLQHACSGMAMLHRGPSEGQPAVEMPKWGFALIFTTLLAFWILISATEYTLKDVIATLSMVETPAAAITVSTPDEPASKAEKEGLLETAPTITLVHAKPITSSIRGTIRHLVSQGGWLARWRGFRIHVLWVFAFNTVTHIISGALPMHFPFRMVFIGGITGAVCANLHAAWTHKVISTPSSLSLWQRVPARSSWKVLALPAAVNAAMPHFSLYLARFFIMALGLDATMNDSLGDYSGSQWTSLIVRIVAVVAFTISCSLFLCLPAIVTLVRVEASLLPEDQDTIVPFDRTFEGKVVPKILGGTGCISFLDAWRSFTWEARRRLMKHYVKIFFIIATIMFIFTHIFAFVVFVAMGPALGQYLSATKHRGHMQ